MAREIIIDTDTLIGYDFPNKNFYIYNKGTTTPRLTKEKAKAVLDIVAPSNTVTLNDLQDLIDTQETLTNLYYTWADNGSYIKTIQLNTWEKYPLTMDAEKQKLYIMNSEIIYDLSTNEGPTHRLQYIQSFYRNQLGLSVSTADLEVLYDILTSYYTPRAYNTFKEREVDSMTGEYLPLQYTNQIKLPDFSGTSKATYTLTLNPTSQYTPQEIADVINMFSNQITLTNSAPSTIEKGSLLTITNTDITGSYTVTDIDENIVYVDKEFQTTYTCPTPNLYIRAYNTTIDEMSMADSTITLTENVPDNILLGDKIRVVGATVSTDYETITLDGEYTVTDKHNKTITVSEQIATDYTYTTGTQAQVYKPIIVGNILRLDTEENQIVLAQAPLQTLSTGLNVAVQYSDGSVLYGSTTAVSTDQKTITVNFTLTNFETGKLIKKVPYSEVLITIETSKDTETMPTGSFEVDDNSQCTAYLGLLPNLATPSESVYEKATMYADTEYPTGMTTVDHMLLKGLYSEVYNESI
jgi:hypothetical protein